MQRKSELLLLVVICLAMASQSRQRVVHKRHLLQSSNGTRTDTLYLRCPAPRAQFYKSQRNDSKSAGRLEINNAIKLDGDAFIYNLLTKNNSGANQQIDKSKGNIVLYVIFLALGLLAMIILTPIFLFCCCKPEKCPPCAKIRHPQTQEYTNCERKWAAIPIIVLAIVAIGTMIAVLVVNPALQKGYSQTRCSVAMLFDDLLNGNYTQDGQQYFMGLKPLQGRINALNNSLQSLLSQASGVSDGGKVLNEILQKIKSIKQEVADIPRGDGSAGHLQLTYSSPIDKALAPTHIQIPSNFPQMLGTNATDESLIGQTYGKLTRLEHKIISLAQLANLIDTGLPKLRQTFDASLQKYAGLVNVVQDKNKQTDQQLSDAQGKYITPLSVVIYIIASFIIVFALIIIFASIMICCFNKLSCRKVVYGSCAVLTLMGILCFVLSLGMSAATVGSHYGCNYVETGILTKKEFVYKFGPIFKNQALTELMAECAAKEGSGNILQRALGSDILQALGDNHQVQTQGEQFNANIFIQQLDSSKKHLIETIQLYQNAQVADINSNADLQILQRLSNPTLYTCSSPGFLSDSWVPSVSQSNVYVTCKVLPTTKVTTETCKTIQQFESRSNAGCTGCIDTFNIFSQFDSEVQVLDALNRRYPSPDCQQFNQELTSVWYNFYNKKLSTLAPISERARLAEQKIDNLNDQIKTQFHQVIKNRINHLQSILDPAISPSIPTAPTSPTSPTNQILPQPITQVNCKVLGEDLELVTQTFCTQIFNYAFSMRILMIIGGFSLLGIMIFATFLGVRTFKSFKQSDKSQSYKNNDEADTGNKVNDPSAFAY